MPTVALQARPATGLIDVSIAILRRRYWDFFLAELIPASPLLVVAVFVSSASIRWVSMANRLMAPLAAGIAAYLVSQEFTGDDVSLGEAVRRMVRRGPGLIGVAILVAVGTLLGLVGLIVGAFVVAALMYTALPAYALEDVSVSGALDRSMALAGGNVLHILGVLLPASFASVISGGIAGYLIGASWTALKRHVDLPIRVETLSVMIAALACLPLAHVPAVVMYYDLRVRREGMDIEAMAAALNRSAPPQLVEQALPNAPGADPA